MTDTIYELYKSYNGKDIDDEYIIQAFDYIMANERDLWPYINNFLIENKDEINLGSYTNENKTITINKQKINEQDEISKNILALQVLKHELEHAKNLKLLEERRKDIESRVIFYSLRAYAIEKDIDPTILHPVDHIMLMVKTGLNYETNPGERIADIKSWKYIVNLLKNTKGDDLLTARTMLYYSYIRGYKDNRYYLECPTYDFLFETNQLDGLKVLRKKVNESDYSLDTRLLCGLPISIEEYNNNTLAKARLQRKK